MLEVPEEQMTVPLVAERALQALAATIPSMQTPEVLGQCRTILTDGLSSLGLPHTSLVSEIFLPFLFHSYILQVFLLTFPLEFYIKPYTFLRVCLHVTFSARVLEGMRGPVFV